MRDTSPFSLKPAQLNVPLTFDLYLQAQTPTGHGGDSLADLTGFEFFAPDGTQLLNVSYTFVVAETLPPNIPEPTTLGLVAMALGAAGISRRGRLS